MTYHFKVLKYLSSYIHVKFSDVCLMQIVPLYLLYEFGILLLAIAPADRIADGTLLPGGGSVDSRTIDGATEIDTAQTAQSDSGTGTDSEIREQKSPDSSDESSDSEDSRS